MRNKLSTHLARSIIITCTRYVRLSHRELARFRHLPTRLNTDRRANWPLVAATGHGCRKIAAFSRSGPDGRERFYEKVSDIRVGRTPKINHRMLRKKKAMHKSVSNDDKRLQTVLKKMGMNAIPGVQEVNIFHSDTVTQFVNPKGRVFITFGTSV